MDKFYRGKKKICQMCAGKDVKYSDVPIITKYINEKGKGLFFMPAMDGSTVQVIFIFTMLTLGVVISQFRR